MKSRDTSARRRVPVLLFLLALASCAAPCGAQEAARATPYRVGYVLSMPRPESHLFEVRVDVEGLRGAGHVDFQMPRWSPGRYAVYDFAKNVQEAKFAPPCGPPVDCGLGRVLYGADRLDTQTWRVKTEKHWRSVTFFYKVYADDLSGTFSQLDERHASFNGGSVFAYVAGHKQDAVTLRVEAPPGWKVFNGYTTREGQTEFSFPNYDTMIDAPTEVGRGFTVETFEVAGRPHRVLVHSFGEEGGRRAELVRQIEKVVRAQVALMGEPDYEQYTFLFHFDPTARRGDGMEHLNSTQIVETGPLSENSVFNDALGTASHEFFHVWNVKRLRPQGLGPWDFTRPVETRGLWIAEGFTNYYGKLALRRAGLWDDARLLASYGMTVTGVENAPGSRLMSAVESSLLAPFLDRSTHEQRTNLPNVSVSYYPKGETLALALDLLIRGRTRGRASLDDVMRRAYDEFYLKSPNDSYYLKGRAYAVEEFERLASQTAGIDLSDFFARHAHGVEQPPYEEALAGVGLRLLRPSGAGAFRIEKDDRATPEARALRDAWLTGKK